MKFVEAAKSWQAKHAAVINTNETAPQKAAQQRTEELSGGGREKAKTS